MNPHESLPHSTESERYLIGCALRSPGLVPVSVAVMPASNGGDSAEYFYHYRHQLVWKSILHHDSTHQPIDPMVITETLRNRGQLDEVGGGVEIIELWDGVPTTANHRHHLENVVKYYRRRRVIEVASSVLQSAYDEPEPDAVIGGALSALTAIAGQSKTCRSMEELVPLAVVDIEASLAGDTGLTGVSTGYSLLDRWMRGMKPGKMIVIAGRPSMGKTTLAVNIAVNSGVPAAIFSLEQTAVDIAVRCIAGLARRNVNTLRYKPQDEQAVSLEKLRAASVEVRQMPIWIDDKGALTTDELRARARHLVTTKGIKLVVVDYMQLLRYPKARDFYGEVTAVSREIQALAKELNVPVIALSQLNRALEKNKRRPGLYDLRESGSIEQDADVVILLSGDVTDEDLPPSHRGLISNGSITEEDRLKMAYVHVAKNRGGEWDRACIMNFFREFTRYEDMAWPNQHHQQPYNEV